MAIVYLKTPPYCAAAFNPIYVVVQTPKARYAQLEKDLAAATSEEERAKIREEMTLLAPNKDQDTLDPLTMVVVIGNNEANKTVVIKREPDSDGKAEIDLSFVLRHAFLNSRQVVYNYAEFDYNLMARYFFLDGDEQGFRGNVINAVRQLGYDDGKGISGFELLTKTPLVCYPGYPFAVSFLQVPWMDYAYRLWRPGLTETGAMTGTITNIYIAGGYNDFNNLDIIKRATGELIAQYEIETGCVPDSPFYIRWINTSGGWDYHMFQRTEDTWDVGDVSNIQRVATNPNDTQQTVAVSAVNTVTVGEGLLAKEDYLRLSALARAPRIEWYNEDLKAWQVIVLSDDFSTTWNTRNAFGNVEFTFLLPRILTQF